jgi:hypothetical protein
MVLEGKTPTRLEKTIQALQLINSVFLCPFNQHCSHFIETGSSSLSTPSPYGLGWQDVDQFLKDQASFTAHHQRLPLFLPSALRPSQSIETGSISLSTPSSYGIGGQEVSRHGQYYLVVFPSASALSSRTALNLGPMGGCRTTRSIKFLKPELVSASGMRVHDSMALRQLRSMSSLRSTCNGTCRSASLSLLSFPFPPMTGTCLQWCAHCMIAKT